MKMRMTAVGLAALLTAAGASAADRGLARRAAAAEKRQQAAARRAELAQKRQEAMKKRKAAAEEQRGDLEKRKAQLEQRRAEAAARLAEQRKALQEHAQERVDQRQENQANRIQHGIRRGYLTPGETAKLLTEQQSIADLEHRLTADGKLTRDEFGALRASLKDASIDIWAEKHDTEGNPMPVFRLGRNVFANEALTARLENPDLTHAEARAILADFHRMLALKNALANDDLTDAQREAAQSAFDTLLNRYFELRAA